MVVVAREGGGLGLALGLGFGVVVARAGAGTGAAGEPSPPVPKLAGPRPPSEPWWIMSTPARTRMGTSTLAASPSSSLEVRKTVPGPPSSWLGLGSG